MGTKGREIVQAKTSLPEIVEALQRIYADEWLAHYNYLLAANLATGINAEVVAEKLKAQSAQELEHAQRVARRLLQLGAEPIRDLAELPRRANCPSFSLPQDPADLKGIINAVLEAERCAIEVYANLVEKTRVVDPVTHEMAEELLADEVDDEEEFENLLG